MKKFIVSLSLIALSGFAMDTTSTMTASERASLLESFRCGTLQVVRTHYLQFPHITDSSTTFVRTAPDVLAYFKNFVVQCKNDADDNMEDLQVLLNKSFVKKIFPHDLEHPVKTELANYTGEEQEDLLQYMVGPDFVGSIRKGDYLVEPCKKWMCALELGKSEVIAETYATITKLRPKKDAESLNKVLADCAVQ